MHLNLVLSSRSWSAARHRRSARRTHQDEFWALFGWLEHEDLDFKRGVGGNVRDAIAAMAMTGGGLIVHGVDDGRNVVGCPLSQHTLDRITRLANECGVEVRVRAVGVVGRELTLTGVPEVRGRIVTTPDGRLLRRAGGDCQPLRGDALARFVREREQRSGEEEPVAAEAGAFDLARVNEALAAADRPPVDEAGIARALADLGVAGPAHPEAMANAPRVRPAAGRSLRGTRRARPATHARRQPAGADGQRFVHASAGAYARGEENASMTTEHAATAAGFDTRAEVLRMKERACPRNTGRP